YFCIDSHTPASYTLSLHDALPIWHGRDRDALPPSQRLVHYCADADFRPRAGSARVLLDNFSRTEFEPRMCRTKRRPSIDHAPSGTILIPLGWIRCSSSRMRADQESTVSSSYTGTAA